MTFPLQNPKRVNNCTSPKAVVLREEFVALTKDPLVSIVLNQLLYWTQRVKDFDLHLQEEQFFNPECSVSSRHGWIYKTANDLIEETMICVDRTTMRRYLKSLMDQGWLETRAHPKNKWDKTSQYRLNLRKLQEDLLPLGFELPGIELFLQKEFTHNSDGEDDEEALLSDTTETAEIPNGDFAHSKEQNFSFLQNSQGNPMVQNPPSIEQDAPSRGDNVPSNVINSPLYIQRLQTENKNIDHTQKTRTRENFAVLEKILVGESVAEEMVRLWGQHVLQKLFPLSWQGLVKITQERQDQLEPFFAFHFKNDMRLWERFCIRVKRSNFMMGGGPNGWKVSLDWILKESNVLKVMEGNYDNSAGLEQGDSHDFSYLDNVKPNPVRDAEKAVIIASIKDPVWKSWCAQLAMGVRLNECRMLHEPLSVSDLSDIAHAWFLECEDEKLVWVGSSDPSVLRRIEDLRHNINWAFAKEHPKARAIRTRLVSEINSTPNPQPSHKGDISHDQ